MATQDDRWAWTEVNGERVTLTVATALEVDQRAHIAAIRINAGLSTLEKECAEQGEDYEEILDQQAMERRMRAERGLPESGGVQYVSNAGPAKKDDDEEGDDAQEQAA